MAVACKTVVVAGDIAEIEHGLCGLVNDEPVAQAEGPFRLVETDCYAGVLRREMLLPVTQRQRRLIESEFRGGDKRRMPCLLTVEVPSCPYRHVTALLVWTAIREEDVFVQRVTR